MKKFILNLLGLNIEELQRNISDLKKESIELNETVRSLKDEATNTYKVYEECFLLITGIINDTPKDKMWWEQTLYMSANTTSDQYFLACRIQASEKLKWAKSHPSLKVQKIFHGACLQCVTPLETGIGTCTGCKYANDNSNADLSKHYQS